MTLLYACWKLAPYTVAAQAPTEIDEYGCMLGDDPGEDAFKIMVAANGGPSQNFTNFLGRELNLDLSTHDVDSTDFDMMWGPHSYTFSRIVDMVMKNTWRSYPWVAEVLAIDPDENQVYYAGVLQSFQLYEYEGEPKLELNFESSSICVPNPKLLTPTVGTPGFFFGDGFGRSVRGTALGDQLINYRTAAQLNAEHAAYLVAEKLREENEWREFKSEFERRSAELPQPFQRRLEFFTQNPSWGPKFGRYELGVCETAMKIAISAKTVEGTQALYDAPYEEQEPVIGSGHSGNSVGASFFLARAFLTDASYVPKSHGALCALVGCTEYGCWASTAEAQKQRDARVEAT